VESAMEMDDIFLRLRKEFSAKTDYLKMILLHFKQRLVLKE
jgi:hypothetical protein